MLKEIFQVPIDTTLATAGYMPYVLGTIVALGLFFGVLVHELAHSLVARAKGIAINSITLMIFGGIATMEEGTPDPKAELPMALVGPIASLVFGIICCGLVYAVPSVTTNPGMQGSGSSSSAISACSISSSAPSTSSRLSHGRGQGAPGMARKADAPPPGHKDCRGYRARGLRLSLASSGSLPSRRS